MCLDDERYQHPYDEDGIYHDPFAPFPYDPRWEEKGQEPVPGLNAFGPITREDRTPHRGEEGLDKALWKLLMRERARKRGWALLWRGPMFTTGRCIDVSLRFTDNEGGARVRATLSEALKGLGYMVKPLRAMPVDREFYGEAERIS
jgi:hypothetical protein